MAQYKILHQEPLDEEKEAFSENDGLNRQSSTRFFSWKSIGFSLSLFLNFALISWTFWTPSKVVPEHISIAGLSYDQESVVNYTSPYNHPDRAVEDAAWLSDEVYPPHFVVALDEETVEQYDLPYSMRWPWDESKGVYSITSGHQLHCLHMFRTTINEATDGIPMSWPERHLKHCLEYMLQNVMCQADDVPLYTGMLHANVYAETPLSGLGTIRKCRNWNNLVQWSKSHSACYRSKHGETTPELEKYKFCPDGSRPWEDTVAN